MSADRYVLFTGSRSWTDYLGIYRTVRLLHVLLGSFTALHGAARGADTYVGMAARMQKIPVEPDPVKSTEWDFFGPSAGNRRNSRMLEKRPILVIGFWDGVSTGTQDCLTKAAALGIPTFVCNGPLDHVTLDRLTDFIKELANANHT